MKTPLKQLRILAELGLEYTLEDNVKDSKDKSKHPLNNLKTPLKRESAKLSKIGESSPIYCKSCKTLHNVSSPELAPNTRCIKCGFFIDPDEVSNG